MSEDRSTFFRPRHGKNEKILVSSNTLQHERELGEPLEREPEESTGRELGEPIERKLEEPIERELGRELQEDDCRSLKQKPQTSEKRTQCPGTTFSFNKLSEGKSEYRSRPCRKPIGQMRKARLKLNGGAMYLLNTDNPQLHLVEHLPSKQRVAGSNPAGRNYVMFMGAG